MNTWDPQQTYDQVAEEYAASLFDELDRKPADRALLDRFADAVRSVGPVCDVGCGPGHVARYLSGRGIDVFGLDLSPRMVEVARRLNPDIAFRTGTMLDLPLEDASLGGIACFYSLIHLPRDRAPRALAEFRRVLRPQGLLLLAVHEGEGETGNDEWFGKSVRVRATLFTPNELEGMAEAAGLSVDDVVSRPPYAEEHPTQRLYIVAHRPAEA